MAGDSQGRGRGSVACWLRDEAQRSSMLKMYREGADAGSSAAFWESTWDDVSFDEAVRHCDVDPLKPLFDRYATPGRLLLEAGCGRGQYVAYLSARNVRVIGVDFAERTLRELRGRVGSLLLAGADVARLPLRTASVDVYYSGGVVEHFEDGPEAALDEARRVLTTDGVLLMSVPYYSPARRLLARAGRPGWKRVRSHTTDPADDDSVFFQYVYTPAEFRRLLTQHGFSVLATQGYSIMWGLYELPILGRLLPRSSQAATAGRRAAKGAGGRAKTPVVEPTWRALLKRLVVAEDASVPVAGLGVRLLRWMAANMMMYICVPTKPA